jgi:hypothetical protein
MLHKQNIFASLNHRERTGRDASPFWMNKRIENNIRDDKQTSHKITFDSPILALGRCNNFVAILDKNRQLSLIDIITNQKIWSVEYTNNACREILVSDSGLVVCTTFGYFVTHSVSIFKDGEKIDTITNFNKMQIDEGSVKIINDIIFIIFKSDQSRVLTQWNNQGKMIHSIQLKYMQSSTVKVACDNEYYVVINSNSRCFAANIVFSLDLITNKRKTSYLFESQDQCIDKIKIINHKLLIGYSDSRGYKNLGVAIFDLKKAEIMYSYKGDAMINAVDLIATDNDIFVHVANAKHCTIFNKTYDVLGCINIKTNVFTEIKTTPHCAEGDTQFTLTDSTLVACYTLNEGSKTYIIDLETKQILKENDYQNNHALLVLNSISDGVLVVPDKSDLYIEDFSEQANESMTNSIKKSI